MEAEIVDSPEGGVTVNSSVLLLTSMGPSGPPMEGLPQPLPQPQPQHNSHPVTDAIVECVIDPAVWWSVHKPNTVLSDMSQVIVACYLGLIVWTAQISRALIANEHRALTDISRWMYRNT